MTNYHDVAQQLEDLRLEMLQMVNEAARLVRGTPEEASAKAYWVAHLMETLGSEEYRTYSPTMRSTVKALEEYDEEEAA